MPPSKPHCTKTRRRHDAETLAKVAKRWRNGAAWVAAQPWAPESVAFYDAQLGIPLGDLQLLKRVVLNSEALTDAAAALAIPKDEAKPRLRQAMTALATGYEFADMPRPGEGSRCRCAHCGGLLPTTNAA